ncbi:hypothetical protein P872_24755 [Rhodonellum psychrophilum GCM71 = DSM 17998]|uniref:Uncharacterized protein n=2 Tax=Rhodonellum TaxID=336827 RepID=U5BVE9_9BACT|nr:hypothetical protein P872_24755 [Rhodonellum psychrophilum GCM71 = DSM 17998]
MNSDFESGIWNIFNLKFYRMRSLLYLIAVIVIIGWIIGFFVYSIGAIIHFLLVVAAISILLAVIRRA